MGGNREHLKWIISDTRKFEPATHMIYGMTGLAFHFLIEEKDITQNVETAKKGILKNGFLIIGTSSDNGPTTCRPSCVEIFFKKLQLTISPNFEPVRSVNIDQLTPSVKSQNYSFCVFKNKH